MSNIISFISDAFSRSLESSNRRLLLINLSYATNVAKDAKSIAVVPVLSLVDANVRIFDMNNMIK